MCVTCAVVATKDRTRGGESLPPRQDQKSEFFNKTMLSEMILRLSNDLYFVKLAIMTVAVSGLKGIVTGKDEWK